MDTPADWPSLERVTNYVRQARRAVDRALDDAPAESVYMALEHRLMHLEALRVHVAQLRTRCEDCAGRLWDCIVFQIEPEKFMAINTGRRSDPG